MQINQPRLPMRTLDPRILPRGPDFTPAFADFGRQTPGGRGVPVSSSSLPQLSVRTVVDTVSKHREQLLNAESCDQEVEEAKTALHDHPT